MILDPKRYQHLLKAVGQGSWGRLDYVGNLVNVRVLNIRTVDGHLRVYFDQAREQIVTGQRFHPMTRVPWSMNPGYVYNITSHLEFVRPVPKGTVIRFVPDPDISSSGVLFSPMVYVEGWKGKVSMSVMTARPTDFDEMVSIGGLLFEKDASLIKKPAKKKEAVL